MNQPPVFVTGYQRSGTTLLGSMIDRHPSFSIFLESVFIPRFYYTQFLYRPLTNASNVDRLASAIVSRPSARLHGLQWNESAKALVACNTYPGILDAIMTAWAQGHGKPRWGDKTPGYITSIHVLHKMFPDAYFVHIVRDARDVWLSAKKSGWAYNPGVYAYARDWRDSINHAREYARRTRDCRYLEVKYEELIGDEESVLRMVFKFLQEDFDMNVLAPESRNGRNDAFAPWPGVNQQVSSNNKRKWIRELPDSEISAVESQAGPLIEELGYGRKFINIPIHKQVIGTVNVLAARIAHVFHSAYRAFLFGIRTIFQSTAAKK